MSETPKTIEELIEYWNTKRGIGVSFGVHWIRSGKYYVAGWTVSDQLHTESNLSATLAEAVADLHRLLLRRWPEPEPEPFVPTAAVRDNVTEGDTVDVTIDAQGTVVSYRVADIAPALRLQELTEKLEADAREHTWTVWGINRGNDIACFELTPGRHPTTILEALEAWAAERTS